MRRSLPLLLAGILAGCQIEVVGTAGPGPGATPPPATSKPTRTPEPRTSTPPRPEPTPGPNDPRPSQVPSARPSTPPSAPPTPMPTPRPPGVAIGAAQPVDLQLPDGERFERPQGLAFDAQGNVYVAEASGAEGHVFRAGPDGRAVRIAGGSSWPYDAQLAAIAPLDLSIFAANLVAPLPGGKLLVSSGGTANTLYAFTPGQVGIEKRFTHGTDSLEHLVVAADGQAYGLLHLATMSSGTADPDGGPPTPMPGRATMGYRVVAIDGTPGGTTVIDQLEVKFGRFALGAGPDGSLWTAGAGELRRRTPDGKQAVVTTDPAFENPDYGMAITPDGTAIYGATQWGVWRYDVEGGQVSWPQHDGFDSFPRVALAPDGALWIACVQPAGLWRIPADRLAP